MQIPLTTLDDISRSYNIHCTENKSLLELENKKLDNTNSEILINEAELDDLSKKLHIAKEKLLFYNTLMDFVNVTLDMIKSKVYFLFPVPRILTGNLDGVID